MKNVLGRNPWWTVLGAVLGLIVGNGPIMQFTFGVLIKPVSAGLGMERGTASTALMAGLVMTGLATPMMGRAVDRYGIRRVAAPAIVLFGLSMIAIGVGSMTPAMYIGLYALAGLMAAGQTPLSYAKAITTRFDGNRGLALGVAMAGVGVGTALMPKLTQALIAHFDWRGAYIGLGVLTIVVALPAVLWLVDSAPRAAAGVAAAPTLEGVTLSQALRNAAFWKLMLAFFLVATAANGTIAHMVPLMTDRGVASGLAISIIGTAGIALIGGRLLAGWCLDRIYAPYVAALFFSLPLLGILLLLSGSDATLMTPAVVLIGLGLGAEVDLIAYLQSRFLGLKAFGEIYGYLFAVFMLGSGLGPFLMGMGFQKLHSYDLPLQALCAALVLACVLVLSLGGYRYAPSDAVGEPRLSKRAAKLAN
jgi:MFS family permease